MPWLTERFAVLTEDAKSEALAIENVVNRGYRGDDASLTLKEGYMGGAYGFDSRQMENTA